MPGRGPQHSRLHEHEGEHHAGTGNLPELACSVEPGQRGGHYCGAVDVRLSVECHAQPGIHDVRQGMRRVYDCEVATVVSDADQPRLVGDINGRYTIDPLLL